METNFKPTKSNYVCSRHFKRENFSSQSTGKIVLKSMTIPSIFPWNKVTPLASKNNSPSQSKASTPPPALVVEFKEEDVKLELEEKPTIKIEESVSSAVLKLEPEEKPAVAIKTKTDSSKKKPLATPAKSPEKAKKSSKRLSAKVASAAKIKTEVTFSPEQVKKPPSEQTPKKKNLVENFVPGSIIEAQNFDGKWMPVKVIEVDMEDREVLVRSCDKNKSKTG